MYNIEVPSDKMRLFDSAMNEANIVYRMVARNEDKTITIVSVKQESQMQIANQLVEKIVATAKLRKAMKKTDENKS